MDWLWFVKDSDFITRLTSDDARWLEHRSRARSFANGAPIPLPSDPAVYLISDGRAQFRTQTDRTAATGPLLEPGDLLGVLPGCAALHDCYQLRATLPLTLVMIPEEAFNHLLDRQPEVAALRLKKRSGLKSLAIEMPLRELVFRTPRQCLAKLFLSLSGDERSLPAHESFLRLQLSIRQMSKLIGNTVENVKLAISQLEADDLIEIRQGEVVLIDPRRLAFLFVNPLTAGRRMGRLRVVS